MVQIIWLILLFMSQVLGIDVSGLASILPTIFQAFGAQ